MIKLVAFTFDETRETRTGRLPATYTTSYSSGYTCDLSSINEPANWTNKQESHDRQHLQAMRPIVSITTSASNHNLMPFHTPVDNCMYSRVVLGGYGGTG